MGCVHLYHDMSVCLAETGQIVLFGANANAYLKNWTNGKKSDNSDKSGNFRTCEHMRGDVLTCPEIPGRRDKNGQAERRGQRHGYRHHSVHVGRNHLFGDFARKSPIWDCRVTDSSECPTYYNSRKRASYTERAGPEPRESGKSAKSDIDF